MRKKVLAAIMAFTTFMSSNVFACDPSAMQEALPSWDYTSDINYLKENGVVSGYEDGSFREDEPITVIEAIVMILKASYTEEEIETMLDQAKLRHDTKGGTYYEAHKKEMDETFKKLGGKYENYTADGFWGYDYLALAWELGLADTNNRLYFFSEAYSETVPSEELMGFDQPLSRDEVAGLLYTMCNSLQQRNLGTPKNAEQYAVDVNDAYIRCQDSILAIVSNGIMENNDECCFKPFNKVTRGQMASYIARCLDEGRRLKSVNSYYERPYFSLLDK